jgi:DNA-binding NarL/FixJ family response regulator
MDKTRVLLADDHAIVRAGIGKALGELDGLEDRTGYHKLDGRGSCLIIFLAAGLSHQR